MQTDFDLAIAGAGIAGLTAGIYAGRAGLKAVVLDQGPSGGAANNAPLVENFPGFEGITGRELMEKVKAQSSKYAEVRELAPVKSAINEEGRFNLEIEGGSLTSKAVIIATGAIYKHLGLPGEARLAGRGVSYCATCDGFFFRGKKVYIVGGGNSAVMEALHLLKTGVDVTLIHRRAQLRAEKLSQDAYFQNGGKALMGMEVEDILGEKAVTGIRVKHADTGKVEELPCSGVFVSVGYIPDNGIAKQLGVELEKDGSVRADSRQRTNVRMVYAAGDVTSGIKQMVTAAAQGATAALSAYDDIVKPYWTC